MQHGYPLHLDATCDQGRGGLFLCLDGWRGWVLHAARIRSENAAELQPALQATLDDFGPCRRSHYFGRNPGFFARLSCRRND